MLHQAGELCRAQFLHHFAIAPSQRTQIIQKQIAATGLQVVCVPLRKPAPFWGFRPFGKVKEPVQIFYVKPHTDP